MSISAEMEKSMKKENFYEKIANSIKERLGDGCDVTLHDVVKNNHVILEGLIITDTSRNVSPTIYLDSFWDAYCAGMKYETLLDRIEDVYRRDTPEKNLNFEFFRNFDDVKDGICYKLVNTVENEELLKELPHKDFLDLSICFYYVYRNDEMGEGTILIHNAHADMWKVSFDTLMDCAKKNTPKLLPLESVEMKDVLAECGSGEKKDIAQIEETKELMGEINEYLDLMPMYVVSNSRRTLGAACILYEGVLEELADKLGGDFYILPSSVHEVILMAAKNTDDAAELKDMIHTINETQLDPEDVLSDSLYYYASAEKQIKVI
jgi:hypothetical protein